MSASTQMPVVPWLLALGALGVYWACQDEEARPGVAGDCVECDSGSTYAPGSSSPGTGGSAGASGGGFAGQGGGAGSGTLVGNIDAVVDTDLSTSPDLGAVVKVRAAGEVLEQVSVDAALDGAFRLEGVDRNPSLWVGVGRFSNDPTNIFVDTLQRVNGQRSVPVELLVMRRPVLEQMVETGFLSNPLELSPTGGHVILRFLDGDRQGIVGVTLLSPAPEDTNVAYDVGDTFSDQTTETAARGTMVLVNLPTTQYPGTATTVTATVNGLRRDVDVRTAAGAVTLVTTVIP
ncbi:MAG: hypothetical protein RL685_2194 [Pseudomonadota bacterium]